MFENVCGVRQGEGKGDIFNIQRKRYYNLCLISNLIFKAWRTYEIEKKASAQENFNVNMREICTNASMWKKNIFLFLVLAYIPIFRLFKQCDNPWNTLRQLQKHHHFCKSTIFSILLSSPAHFLRVFFSFSFVYLTRVNMLALSVVLVLIHISQCETGLRLKYGNNQKIEKVNYVVLLKKAIFYIVFFNSEFCLRVRPCPHVSG